MAPVGSWPALKSCALSDPFLTSAGRTPPDATSLAPTLSFGRGSAA